jgi:hypothetical protein
MALQHLRSSTANKRPVPGNMSDGQLGVNTNSASPGLFFKDSNANLVKVGPVHVGTTAPNASPAVGGTAGNSVGEQWLDTSSSRYVFKVWDGTAWRTQDGEFVNVTGDVMTGALGIIAGSAGSPGLYVSGDANTGLYSPGADQLALATGGTGQVFVNGSGNLGVGTLNATNAAGKIHSRADGDEAKSLLVLQNRDTGGSAGGAINFVNGAVDLSDNRYSYIRGIVTGAGENGNHLVFGTNANGQAPSEQLRITSDRYVRLASGTGGIQFGGDTAAANALDDYEEGTFTPTVTGSSTAGTGTYNTNGQVGRYTKIGNRVSFTIYVNWSAHTGTGNLRVSGLPFTSNSAANAFNAVALYAGALTYTGPMLQAYFGAASTTIIIGQMTAAGVASGVPMDTAANLTLTGHYEV